MLAKQISTLLSQESEVIIPGFGRLYSKYEGSKITGAELLPPSRKVLFDPNSTHDPNEALKAFTMKSLQKEESEWQSLLADFIGEVRQGLEEKQRHEVPALGTFSRNADNTIEFSPAASLRTTPTAFGLPALNLKPVTSAKKENKETVQPQPTPETATTPAEKPKEKKEIPLGKPVKPSYTKQDFEKEKSNSNNELITWLVIIPLIFVFAFLVWLFVQRGTTSFSGESPNLSETGQVTEAQTLEEELPAAEETNPLPEEDPETNPSEETAGEEQPISQESTTEGEEVDPADPDLTEEQARKALEEEALREETTPPVVVPDSDGMLESPTGQYYLIMGSFQGNEKAQELRQKLIREGATAYLMPNRDKEGWVRVAVGGYPDLQAANQARTTTFSKYQSWVKKW